MKTVPTKCKFCGYSLQCLSTAISLYHNSICLKCQAHYAGATGKARWYNKKEWESYVNIVDGEDWSKKYACRP